VKSLAHQITIVEEGDRPMVGRRRSRGNKQTITITYQPEAIWSSSRIVFDKEVSTTQNVILAQGRSALSATVRRIDRLHELTREGPIKNAAFHPEIAPVLSDLCYQAGLASTILFNNSKQGYRESQIAFKLRQERYEYVERYCSSQGINPVTLRDREVRNSLTHIDERLADILTEAPRRGWFINAAVGSKTEFVAPEGITANYCRSYAIKEDVILHLGNELDVSRLRDECVAVLAVVFGVDYDGQFTDV